MALTVEDGSGVTGAESYISLADADTYLAARGFTAWASLSEGDKEAALRNATEYMEGRYVWKGERVADGQALSWPRECVYAYGYLVASDEVPGKVSYACAKLALKASAGELLPDAGAQVKQETVGPISVTYADGARQATVYKDVDAMLSEYVEGMSRVRVTRA